MNRHVLLTIGVAAMLAISACSSSSKSNSSSGSGNTLPAGPSCVEADNGKCMPIAPSDKRVDLKRPKFSNPTRITNPLFPIGQMAQTIFGGKVDGERWHTEVTLLPGTKTIEWEGQRIETLISQYVAFSGGRIYEVALDWYAQADDGAVWYLGEDVFFYEDGSLKDTHGTWLAGKDGNPACMIMPGTPRVGDVYRPENNPGPDGVFEEVTVKSVDQTVAGPRGPVSGAMVVAELHRDLKAEDKYFAPGYGEFRTGTEDGDLETMALTVPIDALPGPQPAELGTLATAARAVLDAAQNKDWPAATAASTKVQRAWDAYRSGGVPEVLGNEMSSAVGELSAAVTARNPNRASQSAIDVAQVGLSFELRHCEVVDVDKRRLELWTRQLTIDAAAQEHGHIAGDSVTLKWIWDRVRHTVDQDTATPIDTARRDLQSAVERKDLAATARTIPALAEKLTAIQPR